MSVTETLIARLKGLDKTNRIKLWSISVVKENDNVCSVKITHGLEGKKLQTTTRKIRVGKNLNKINSTTPFEQAIFEAKSLVVKKIGEGYNDVDGRDLSFLKRITSNLSIPAPMLAHEYSKHKEKIVFPCIVQPKIDGIRAILIPGVGLYSRTRKQFNGFDNLLKSFAGKYILDGELWSPDLKFEDLVSTVKNSKKSKENIFYYIYDIIDPEAGYGERYDRLLKIPLSRNMRICPTIMVNNEKEIDSYYETFMDENYEGLMVRNMCAKYENNRSFNLLKRKEFDEAEFTIVGFTNGDGLDADCVIWICEANGLTFNCRYGERELRKFHLKNGNIFVGKRLTVKYQGLTNNGIPRFPVGKAIRDYESE